MSQIILNWLNDQIQLSKRIINFEQDFNNGYLFGQLLSKYNQQLNFAEFQNKDDKKSKIKNFQLLFDTFGSLNVTFNSLVANDIINKKIGVAKKLLYELKMHLQKTNNNNAFNKITKMTKTQLSPLKKLKVSKDQYDKIDKQHFIKQLNQLHPAQKTINQQKILKKFTDFHQEQVTLNNVMNEKDQQAKLLQQKKFRDKQRDNLKKTADFRNQWQRSNSQKWAANLTVRHIQKQKDQLFKTKLKQTKIQNKTMSELNAIKALDKDINQFQKKFIKNIKKPSVIQDSDESQQQQIKDQVVDINNIRKKQSKLNTKLKLTKTQSLPFSQGLKKKNAPQVTQQQKHQRQKKRRKMIVQQNKRFQLIEISRREKYILSTIQQTSKQQKQLQYQIWRVWQNKQIIRQNKNLQQQKQKQKQQIKEINLKFKREQLLKTYRQQNQLQIRQTISRQQNLLNSFKVTQRKQIYQQCKSIISSFIMITQQCFKYQQQKNQQNISKDLIDHLFNEFVQNVETVEDKVMLELDNYIHGKGEWNIMLKYQEGQVIDPAIDNAIPVNVVNNYTLGNVLRLLYENKYKNINITLNGNNQSTNTPQQLTKKSQQFVLSLVGLEFAGKHLIAQALKNNFNFNIIEIQKLILRKIQQYQQIKDKVSQISEFTQKLVNLAYKGQQIPNDLLIELIHQQVIKNPKSILINYPITYSQSLDLVKCLSSIQPSDSIQKDQLTKKIQQFSRIVYPTQQKIIPRPLKQCGLDMVLWVDIDNKTSFNRFLGRRWIDDKIVHVKDQVADNVYKLQIGDKASSQILKNHQKIINKKKISQFFNQFGIEVIKHLELYEEKPQIVQENQNNKEPEQQQFRQGQNNIQKQQKQSQKKISQRKLKSARNIQQKQQQVIQKPSQNLQKKIQIQKFIRKTWQSINGMCSIEQIQRKVIQIVEQAVRIKNMKTEQQKQKQAQKQNNKQKQQQQKQKQQQIKQKCVLSSQQLIKQRLKMAVDSVSLQSSFVQNLCSLWDKIQNSTITSLTKIFKAFSEQQKDKNDYISSTKRNYINMLTREDKKFSLVKDFQIKYNKFYEQHPDMVSQDYTKDQLHQRVDDLQDQLFDCIEQKKQDSIEERKNIMESGWRQSQLDQFYNSIRIMLQTQLNRYNASQKIINDFYSKKYSVTQTNFEETNCQIPYDINVETFTKDNTFPRLTKLIADTMRIFNKQEQVVDDKNKKGGKAPPPKKDDKKGAKKVQVQQTKEPTPQQLQMKRAINIQKSIFRYRVNIIQEFSLKKMSQLVKQSQKLYKQIQSYYLYTYDIENKCVFNLSKILRNKIQKQQKIQHQIQINYVDVVVNQLIRNFQKQKPIIQPAKQKQIQDRYTLANIYQMINFIQNESQSLQKISTKRLIYLLNLIKNNENQRQILPITWRQLTQQQIQSFVCRLDSQKKGFIQLWKILIFITMSNISYPTQQILKIYFQDLTSYGMTIQIQKTKFIQTKSWFDQQYIVEQNTRLFKRNQQLKEIIFDLIKQKDKNNKQYVNANNLIQNISLKWYEKNINVKKNNQVTYFDVGFKM